MMILACQGMIFILNYHFGTSGMQVLHRLQVTKQTLQDDIAKLQADNNILQEKIQEWESNLFFQEKYAREKLQMQKAEEKIYFSSRRHVCAKV